MAHQAAAETARCGGETQNDEAEENMNIGYPKIQWAKVECPVCEGKGILRYGRGIHFDYMRCSNCRAGFVEVPASCVTVGQCAFSTNYLGPTTVDDLKTRKKRSKR